jgi:hypothetical protein
MPNPTSFLNQWSYSVVKIEGDSFTIVRLTSMPTSASPKTRQGFDYASLDPATSRFVQQRTGEIRLLMKRTAQDIIELGQKLIAVKDRLGHGYFLDWLEAEFGWSYPTAARFMQVANSFNESYQIDNFAPSALYEIFAPSTPVAARDEALARAASGEPITNKLAKAIKQKYVTPSTKPKQKSESEPKQEPSLQSPLPTLTPPAPLLEQPRPKPQIVAILPPKQPLAGSEVGKVLVSQSGAVPQGTQPTTLPVSAPYIPGEWWQLGRHLLYCGDPNSSEFLERVPEQLNLLLTFPTTSTWQSQVQAKTTISLTTPSSPQGNNLTMFEDMVEMMLLLYSGIGDTVVHNYIPLIESFWVIDRLNRRSLLAEPDPRRCNAVISDWKKAGLRVERINRIN